MRQATRPSVTVLMERGPGKSRTEFRRDRAASTQLSLPRLRGPGSHVTVARIQQRCYYEGMLPAG